MAPIRETGKFETVRVGGEAVNAFVPHALPPDPPLKLDADILDALEKARGALGRLDGMTGILPDSGLFISLYGRKEAVLSSQIEGTQSSLSDLLLFESGEATEASPDDNVEVFQYVAAMNYGLQRLRDGMPLSLRLIKEIHGVLLQRGRGRDRAPGEFRRSQSWIGGTRPGNAVFVPPPPHRVLDCMGELELFLRDKPERTSTLIKAALAHVQFETIHPFLDGNGRVGRLLITFLLCEKQVIAEPILYLSLYFKRNRDAYYEMLQRVRVEGDWEGWLRFFLTGVKETADQAVSAAKSILALFEKDRRRLQAIGRQASSVLRVHEVLQKKPIASIPQIADATGLAFPTVSSSIDKLIEFGVVQEVTGRRRDRRFLYREYLALLNAGTEPT